MSNQLAVFQKPKEITDFLNSGKTAIERALPKHLVADRFIRLAVTAWSTNPGIRSCTGQSILQSVMVAAQIGLEPGVAGQGYLIPYKSTCTFVPGWQGLVGLLNNSGRATAWTGAVFEGDEWDFALGSQPRCFHRPGPHFGDPQKMIWVYACGKVNGSEQPVVEAWPMARVWAHRDKFNKVGAKHYSFNHPEMYARKVVLLQVLKYMPRSVELNNAIVAADSAEIGRATRVEEGVIVDVTDDMPQATLGAGNAAATPLDPPPARQAKPSAPSQPEDDPSSTYQEGGDPEPTAEEPAPPTDEPSAAPSAADLKKSITMRMADLNIGKLALNKHLIALGWLESGQSFETATAKQLADFLDGWEQIVDRIKNA